jgi:pyridoxal 5'-phosphate synthase pdxT subunit
VRIGVLALQGAFREHAEVLQRIGAEAVEVRLPRDLAGLDGIVIPGGESTTIRKLLAEYDLIGPLAEMVRAGTPALGTCAGLIMLADRVDGEELPGLHGLAVDVQRNAFGRQVDSFEADLPMADLGDDPFHAVFIRAPIVTSADGDVEILSRLPDGRIVAVRQGNVIGIAFHPELTHDDRLHRYFLDLVSNQRSAVGSSSMSRS